MAEQLFQTLVEKFDDFEAFGLQFIPHLIEFPDHLGPFYEECFRYPGMGDKILDALEIALQEVDQKGMAGRNFFPVTDGLIGVADWAHHQQKLTPAQADRLERLFEPLLERKLRNETAGVFNRHRVDRLQAVSSFKNLEEFTRLTRVASAIATEKGRTEALERLWSLAPARLKERSVASFLAQVEAKEHHEFGAYALFGALSSSPQFDDQLASLSRSLLATRIDRAYPERLARISRVQLDRLVEAVARPESRQEAIRDGLTIARMAFEEPESSNQSERILAAWEKAEGSWVGEIADAFEEKDTAAQFHYQLAGQGEASWRHTLKLVQHLERWDSEGQLQVLRFYELYAQCREMEPVDEFFEVVGRVAETERGDLEKTLIWTQPLAEQVKAGMSPLVAYEAQVRGRLAGTEPQPPPIDLDLGADFVDIGETQLPIFD